jgi:integrase
MESVDKKEDKPSKEMQLFMSSIKSPETRLTYSIYFRKYREFMFRSSQDLFCENNPQKIADKIIEFIIMMKEQENKSYPAIHNYVSAVLAFYKINDIVLNVSKINKFIPAKKKVKPDRGYYTEEIASFLNFADERMRVIILIMSSAGLRVGGLPSLKIRNLESNNKLTVYEGDNEEYYTFITPECRRAVDTYLDMRKRYGEILTPNSYLIREQFDTKDQFQIAKPRQMTTTMVKCKMQDLQERTGIRSKEIGVPITHGFRKFFGTTLEESGVSPIKITKLLGQKDGLLLKYAKPREREVYKAYEQAINNLTINQEHRLKNRIEKLEIEKSQLELLTEDVAMLKRKMRNK